jgi:hypothetical protein
MQIQVFEFLACNPAQIRTQQYSPRAICNDLNNSRVLDPPKPSAMFAVTELEDLLTCATIPN